MNSKINFPSMVPGVGSFRFWLPLLGLLLCGNAWAVRYQDIDLNNCPPLIPANRVKYAAKLGMGTPANPLTCEGLSSGCDIAPANAKGDVFWEFENDTGNNNSPGSSNCTGTQPNLNCAGINLTLPAALDTQVSGTAKAQMTTSSPLNTLATSYFFLTVRAAPGGSPECKREYRFRVTTDGGGWGDPHITTVDGVHYDFQSAGEFIALRGGGLEIQTRQTAVATASIPGANPYTGLASCVSIYTAVAARVGAHRVSYQPNFIEGIHDPKGLQLRVDGALVELGPEGIDLGSGPISTSSTPGVLTGPSSGGRIVKSPAGDGIEIHYPDGTRLVVTPAYWNAQKKWYLNVNVYGTTATEGIMGLIANDGWLPALPDGTSLGPKPESLHQRYVDLYEKFADAWRVTDETSLFDYPPGASTATFTLDEWPRERPSSCAIQGEPSAPSIDVQVAETHCASIIDQNMKADCVFDVAVTGEPGFAQTYQLTEQLQPGLTATTVKDDKDPTQQGESVTFTATVAPTLSRSGQGTPSGAVQFVVDGGKVGNPVALDSTGRATWSTSSLQAGKHQVVAQYIPSGFGGLLFLASSSPEESHTVIAKSGQFFWLVILLILVLIILIVWWYRRK